jgi:hypothetical protein
VFGRASNPITTGGSADPVRSAGPQGGLRHPRSRLTLQRTGALLGTTQQRCVNRPGRGGVVAMDPTAFTFSACVGSGTGAFRTGPVRRK